MYKKGGSAGAKAIKAALTKAGYKKGGSTMKKKKYGGSTMKKKTMRKKK